MPLSMTPVVLAIGTERGGQRPNSGSFLESGFALCSLGDRILKTETAAAVAVSVVLAGWGMYSPLKMLYLPFLADGKVHENSNYYNKSLWEGGLLLSQIAIPYGTTHIDIEIDANRLNGILISQMSRYNPMAMPSQLVEQALEHPVGSPKLCELARAKRK
jgi:hypothetical protein